MPINKEFNTPMMRQYLSIKKKYEDCILFFRLGDFYEMFLEDAKIGASVLGITLTKRSRGKDGKVPMAGIPYHAANNYINKLVQNGYKVAICEQLSLPNETDLVERDVVRVITPGTILDENALDKKFNNFIMSLHIKKSGDIAGIALADISTGTLSVFEINSLQLAKELADAISKIQVTECVLTIEDYDNTNTLKLVQSLGIKNISAYSNQYKKTDSCVSNLKKHFQVKTLEGFGIQNYEEGLISLNLLLEYLTYTQKGEIKHMRNVKVYKNDKFMELDKFTISNLELLSTLKNREKRGSLIDILDTTVTPMGGRLLKTWILNPLKNKEEIYQRLVFVNKYVGHRTLRTKMRTALEDIADIERLLSRIAMGLGTPRDVINLKNSLVNVTNVVNFIDPTQNIETQIIKDVNNKINILANEIQKNIKEDPPVDPKQGGVINEGVSLDLDVLKKQINKSKNWLIKLEESERKRTGISSLKIRFNKVFGYYIEISKSNLGAVPKDYDRKQTLVNAERFITPELKEHEELILTAQEKTNLIEYEIFIQMVERVIECTKDIQNCAKAIAKLDCLLSFAHNAEINNYCKPEISNRNELIISNGRHPVVEQLLDSHEFVPNDTTLDNKKNQLWVITGPNMAGKSVYIRQVALLVLMAQIGSYIPAEKANIGIVDKIFVRSGASDAIAEGLSTFMVEMTETANILNNATSKSLVVMDEIGRGTSTFDGISIAWAVAEYFVSNTYDEYPKTLFATHYHELEDLEKVFPNKVKNYQLAIKEHKTKPIFLHKVIPGGAGHSYGIAVAKLAGIPIEITDKAEYIIKRLESGESIQP